jgi:von Willebrand factor type A domain
MKTVRLFVALSAGLLVLGGCAKSGDTPVVPTPPAMESPEPVAPPPPPVPAPPTADYESADAAGEVVVTGSKRSESRMDAPVAVSSVSSSEIARGRRKDASPESMPPPSRPDVMPPRPIPDDRQRPYQAGLLTAGDYDDLLNPSLFARYAERYLQNHRAAGIPFVDTRDRVSVRVTTPDGKPVPFARVSISGNEWQNGLSLLTGADGTVSAFPKADRLGDRIVVSVAGAPARAVSVAALPADRLVTIQIQSGAPAVRSLDLLLNIDTTGSMSDELTYLQSELAAIVNTLRQNNPGVDVRVGLIVYRDTGDDYVVRSFPFTSNIAELQEKLRIQRADGGGDYPEAVDQALSAAVDFGWREDAAKAMLFVADAPPHDEKMGASWNATQALRRKGVHIVPVAASGVADEAEFLMRNMAATTQSRYIFLTDDSGVGNAHAEPDVPCYIVTRLNGLVGRVLSGFVSGRRVEPGSDQVIRRVGDYDKGLCLPSRRR